MFVQPSAHLLTTWTFLKFSEPIDITIVDEETVNNVPPPPKKTFRNMFQRKELPNDTEMIVPDRRSLANITDISFGDNLPAESTRVAITLGNSENEIVDLCQTKRRKRRKRRNHNLDDDDNDETVENSTKKKRRRLAEMTLTEEFSFMKPPQPPMTRAEVRKRRLGLGEEDLTPPLSTSSEAETISTTPPKRKRGRPKKNLLIN